MNFSNIKKILFHQHNNYHQFRILSPFKLSLHVFSIEVYKTMRIYYLIFSLLLLTACKHNTKGDDILIPEQLPTADITGAKMMPNNIPTVHAPFETACFKKPVFIKDTFKLSLSAEDINTCTIQKSIDNLSKLGGGTILVPKGNWFTGRIELKDNIDLHFEDSATLSFSGEIEDFLPVVFTRIEGIEVMSLGACIYANGAKNIAITGNGRLVGPAEGSIRKNILTTEVIDNVIDPNTPVEERIVDGKTTPWIFPPMFISPINCEKVYIEGITLENTAFWNIVPIYCNNVIIRGVTVHSVGIPRGDGIDIESSKNVLIEYSTLSCGDDCFTMKAGRGLDGLRVNKATENVIVRYCLAKEGHGGITCGSETAGTIRNLYVHHCVFDNVGVGIRFKTRRPRGGGGVNLTYEQLRLNNRYTAIKWDMLGSKGSVGELAERLPAREINELTPRYKNIQIRNVLIENSTHFLKVIGIPESPVNNLTIENATVNCSNFLHVQDLTNATFRNIDITGNDSILDFTDARNIRIEDVDFQTTATEVQLKIHGELSDSIKIKSSAKAKDNIYIKH